MKVHNLSNLPVIDYRQVKPLQGNLKDLDQTNHDRLLRVLNKRGFTTPLFVWYNPVDSGWYLLDGHQRHRVMMKNDLNDNGDYNVPYVLIPAISEKEAREQLLEITSQYGRITQEGLDEFAFDLDLPSLDINFDALMDVKMELPEPEAQDAEKPEPSTHEQTCPACGHIFES